MKQKLGVITLLYIGSIAIYIENTTAMDKYPSAASAAKSTPSNGELLPAAAVEKILTTIAAKREEAMAEKDRAKAAAAKAIRAESKVEALEMVDKAFSASKKSSEAATIATRLYHKLATEAAKNEVSALVIGSDVAAHIAKSEAYRAKQIVLSKQYQDDQDKCCCKLC